MTLKSLAIAAAVAVAAAPLAAPLVATPAVADLVFPLLSYRTGAYANNGIPFADGYEDYFTLLNERDGGIGGVPARVIECETAYNTQRGVECYESTKNQGALIYQPLSTGITYQLIPRVTADGIPLHTLGYGRASAANGRVFEYIFNYPANYWHGASAVINHLLEINDSDLSGKTIVLLHHNSAYGREPIRTLQALSEQHGFELDLQPVDHPGQEQRSQWLHIRRSRPDYVVMWGWGVMNQVAIRQAVNFRFPMENFIGVWWSGSENDVVPAGRGADGYKAITFHNVGSDFPVFDDIQTYVVDRGLAAGAGDNIGAVLYNRGLYAAMLAAEAARAAQIANGVDDITPAMMRDAMEALSITEERMAELGLPNFGPAFDVSCANHGGPGLVAVQQWDANAREWRLISEFAPTDASIVDPLIEEDSAAFAAENGVEPRACE